MVVMAAGEFSVLAYLGSQKNTIMMSDNSDKIDIIILEQNKAKAISAELLELSLKNKLEETGKTR